MKFKTKFEQYKTDQSKIDKIPTIKPEFHFTVDDFAKKMMENHLISEREIDALEMVYSMTQDLEKDLLTFLSLHRSKEIITKEEFLVVTNFFLTAHQNGPDTTRMKENIFTFISVEDLIESIVNISIPSYTRQIIINTYSKINNSKNYGN